MSFFSGFALVVLACLWIITVAWLGYWGAEVWADGAPMVGGAMVFGAICLFALPFGFVLSADSDAHANELCLSGHQEWHTTHGVVPVGKVVVPTTNTSKVWVCDRWEAR